jgi:molybdopterin-guanine dinucleotide biosynthesis protein A
MAVCVADALHECGCVEVVAVGGDGVGLAAVGLPFVADTHPGEGPLGGVITALRHFIDRDAVAVVACDLPALSAASMRSLFDSLAGYDVAVAIGDQLQPLCAVWRPQIVSDLLRAFDAGERSMRGALDDLSVVKVTLPERDLVNVNAADDLPR